ncbi:hypothetical protein M407DRAFT_29149 [Tulasnella calospora MUT 4182]|uniref:Uncharacterized protein n=1 Tax=Tulasnella calospora MUT 4182 TaxID=1051891 RepID=A0A0C3Q009_9AGAM|nr:hypothetical protein M407DRAFT_29149 [Tulasnella calospora MUT 4182]
MLEGDRETKGELSSRPNAQRKTIAESITMSIIQEKANTTPDVPLVAKVTLNVSNARKLVLPSTNNRYNQPVSIAVNNKVALPKAQLISPWTRVVSFSPPIPLIGWECHVHPEGDKYYRYARLRTVTPVSPLNLVARILEQAATVLIEAPRSAQGDNTIEIYLNIPESGKNAVQYCYIDHTNRQVFWARATSTVELGLESFESDGFLKSALTGEYWNHLENFPCHQIFWADAEDELKGILGHGAIDDLTSPGSTCPWSAKECAEYTSIIEKFKTCDHNEHVPYRVVSIARLWAMIARVRHINQYGLTSPRLDPLQGLFENYQSQKKASFKIALGEIFCFGMSRSTFTRLTALWNGRVGYQRHWHRFFEEMHGNWINMGVLSLVIWTHNLYGGDAALALVHRM